jgi:hypothetical protein
MICTRMRCSILCPHSSKLCHCSSPSSRPHLPPPAPAAGAAGPAHAPAPAPPQSAARVLLPAGAAVRRRTCSSAQQATAELSCRHCAAAVRYFQPCSGSKAAAVQAAPARQHRRAPYMPSCCPACIPIPQPASPYRSLGTSCRQDQVAAWQPEGSGQASAAHLRRCRSMRAWRSSSGCTAPSCCSSRSASPGSRCSTAGAAA